MTVWRCLPDVSRLAGGGGSFFLSSPFQDGGRWSFIINYALRCWCQVLALAATQCFSAPLEDWRWILACCGSSSPTDRSSGGEGKILVSGSLLIFKLSTVLSVKLWVCTVLSINITRLIVCAFAWLVLKIQKFACP